MEQLFERNKIGSELTQHNIDEIQKLGALHWPPQDIAIYFGFDVNQFKTEYNDEESIVYLNVNRGRLKTLATVDMKMIDNASAGDMQAVNMVYKIHRDKEFKIAKLDIFGSFDDKKLFERIYGYIAKGKSSDLATNEKLYLDLLTIINSLDKQFGRRSTIKLLTSENFKFTYAKAVDYYNQADSLFYSNRGTTKEALRNKYAEMLENLSIAATKVATSSRDYQAAGELLTEAAKVRGLNNPEIEKLPPQAYLKQYRVFSLTPEVTGLPEINRNELSQQIDTLRIPEMDKKRIKNEAFLGIVDIVSVIDNGQQSET